MIDHEEIPEFHPHAKLYVITYPSQGLLVKGYLAIPRGEGPFPLLIYCRGGIRHIGMTKLAWVNYFVSEGFMVFAPFYRGNRGGEGREDFGGSDRYDVIEALPWLKQHPLIDPQRIHVFGFSRGAIPAWFTAIEYSFIRSVAIWGGVSDLALTYEERIDMRRMLKRLLGGTPAKVPQQFQHRSPVYTASEIQCPVLIIHGARDRQVGAAHAYRLMEAMQTYGKRYSFWIYDDQGHHFTVGEQIKTVQKMLTWMKKQELNE